MTVQTLHCPKDVPLGFEIVLVLVTFQACRDTNDDVVHIIPECLRCVVGRMIRRAWYAINGAASKGMRRVLSAVRCFASSAFHEYLKETY